MPATIKNIAVVGAGLMGHGIALEFAAAGKRVAITDRSSELVAAAMKRARTGLDALADAGRISHSDIDPALSRISPVGTIEEAVADADLMVEAVFENLDVKRQVFAEADRHAPAHAILLSNSSSFMPSLMAAATHRPDRVAVAHYFNPPHLLPLVEVVRGPATSDKTIDTVMALYRSIGKHPALVQREVPGFIGNRLQNALFREALALVESGVATAEDVDTVVRYGFGRRLAVAGPFEIWEQIGWDLVLTIGRELFPDIARNTEPPKILEDKVKRGELGTKTGRGFYDWTPESAEALRGRIAQALGEMARWDSGEQDV